MRTLQAGSAMRGFSLLELLVVMAIVSMVAVIAPRAYMVAVPNAQMRASAHELASTLGQARARSLGHNMDAVVYFDVEKNEYRIGSKGKPIAMPEGVSLKVFVAGSEKISERIAGIRFFHDGGATGGRVEMRRGDAGYQIEVDWLVGNVTIKRLQER